MRKPRKMARATPIREKGAAVRVTFQWKSCPWMKTTAQARPMTKSSWGRMRMIREPRRTNSRRTQWGRGRTITDVARWRAKPDFRSFPSSLAPFLAGADAPSAATSLPSGLPRLGRGLPLRHAIAITVLRNVPDLGVLKGDDAACAFIRETDGTSLIIHVLRVVILAALKVGDLVDRKSTRLNSSHHSISYA